MTDIQKCLFDLADEQYRDFISQLIPNIDKEVIIGIRTPVLRNFVRQVKGVKADEFITSLPHRYFEENNLHAFIICQMKDFDKCIEKLDAFLPFIDNWATCDSVRPACFKHNTLKLLPYITRWLKSSHTYTVRFGIEMLMCYYLEENFKSEYLETVSEIISGEYYINMMIAWFFATALAKRYEETLPFIEQKRLSPWIHNKTIQKAVESYRITNEQKEYLKTLKLKHL